MEVDSSGDVPAREFPEILRLCARAEALVAELLLLYDRAPAKFFEARFGPVLFDLRYFESPREFEARINASTELQTLEDELNDCCSTYTQRFFLLTNGVVQFHTDLNKYLIDLQEGLYIEYTLEGIIKSRFGFELLIELISKFGCILLLIEHLMQGPLREKLLIFYLRTHQSFNFPNLDKILSLCRSNNLLSSLISKPSSVVINIQKTEDLFAKFPLPKQIIDTIITSCLKQDEISKQGGFLYVLLNYSNNFLRDGVFMREVIDRVFKENWVVPIFLHFSIDLFVSWENYKEAKEALVKCVSPQFIRNQCVYHCTKVKELIPELDSILSKGVLNKEYVLQNSQNILSFVKNCNLTLRWLLLHRMGNDKKARDIITSVCLLFHVDKEMLLQLILKVSKLEFEVKRLYNELLEQKEDLWNEKKRFVFESMVNLSQNHLGFLTSSIKFKSKGLNEWLENLSSEVNLLEYKNTGISDRSIFRIISVLKEIERLNQIQENVQIKNLISKAQESLHDLIKVLSLNKDFICDFSVITDIGCAWGFLPQLKQILQNKIKKDPSNLLLLPSFFLKFRSILTAPFLRIEQTKSSDLLCVSNYYSSKYSTKIFEILEIIPVILLETQYSEDALNAIVSQSNRINKEDFENIFQIDAQLKQAREAANLCLISEGIMVISQTFDGIIHLDLKSWLEEKLGKEVSKRLENKLQSSLLSVAQEQNDLEGSLNSLLKYITFQSQRLKFLQDIFYINGTHIWNKSFTSVLEKSALTEETKIKEQAQGLQIHTSNPKSFLGLLLQKIIKLTDPSKSMFIEPMLGWFDAEGNELVGLHFFALLESCVGPVGLTSLNSLLTKLIRIHLENTLNNINATLVSRVSEEIQKLDELLGPPVAIPLVGLQLYNHLINMFGTTWKKLVDDLAIIGQMQLLLSLINFRLNSTSKCKAGILNSATDVLISTISHQKERIIKEIEEDSTRDLFFRELNQKRKMFGLICPFDNIYASKNAPVFLSRFMSLLSISQLPNYVLDFHLGTLTSRSKKALKDFSPLIIGIATLMRQFNPMYTTQYIQFMSQYTRTVGSSFVSNDESNKESTVHTSEVQKAVFWLRYFCKYVRISEGIIDSNLALFSVLQS
ncbi:hypothetical protein LUZ60_004880 [Juncus effusus]|nr:hypothetical protein LUZ60_004880 [Juncus effusus]